MKLNDLLRSFFPSRCVMCDAQPDLLCIACKQKIKPITGSRCLVCGIPYVSSPTSHICANCQALPPKFDEHRALFVFDDLIKKIIYDLKYHAGFWTTKILKPYFEQTLSNWDSLPPIDCIVPVPLHDERLRDRGFNQSVVLAKLVSHILKAPLKTGILSRQVATPSQTSLDKQTRQRNLKNAFIVRKPELLLKKSLLLIDDVFTTGATMNACAATLRKAGASQIYATTIAMVV